MKYYTVSTRHDDVHTRKYNSLWQAYFRSVFLFSFAKTNMSCHQRNKKGKAKDRRNPSFRSDFKLVVTV